MAWKLRQAEFKNINAIARTISVRYKNILNYIENRKVYASAETFNAKVGTSRAQFRWIKILYFYYLGLIKF